MTEMTCRQTVDALMDYTEARLSQGLTSALEQHLLRCPRCVEFIHSYREAPAIFRRATAVELQPDRAEGLRQRIASRLGWST